MPIERYFLPTSFEIHHSYLLKGAEFHHLAHVMRTKQGDQVELVNGQGFLAEGDVVEIKKDYAQIKVQSLFQEKPCTKGIILAQAFPKPNRLDFILEKGTELGVEAFWLFPGLLSAKKEFFPHQLERAQSLMIAAMKQCGRLTLPSLMIQPFLKEWPTVNSTLFFGDLDPKALPFEKAWKMHQPLVYPTLFVTGPESGFHKQEVDSLKQRGAVGVKLHDHILRTDTASLAAVSLMSHWRLLDLF